MAARELWDVVKHEVRDMLVPEQVKRREGRSLGGSPKMGHVPRDDTPMPPTIYPSVITNPSTAEVTDSTLALAEPTITTPSTTSAIATETAAPTNSSDADSEGMSVAAKAGIIIGALGGILVVFVIVWLVLNSRRKKLARRRQQIEDDEKINGPFADSAAIRPAPNKAPRLSLRPVSQLLPNFKTPQAERRQSRGIALTLNPVSNSTLSRPTGGSAWERPTVRSTMASPNSDPNKPGTSTGLHPNPFHDNHRVAEEPVSPISSVGSFENRVGVAKTTDPIPEPVSPILDNDEMDNDNSRQQGGASNLARKTSIRKDLPKPLDLTKPPSPLYAVPPSPTGTEYSMHSIAPGQAPGPSASAAAIAAAGGPSHSTVHRVQLDFKPTLQDEMELRAGQLVRLLHEYDDGWALCIRLDRSQQGVVPRTCLSTRPVKPRPPQGPGPQQNKGGYQRRGPPVNPSPQYQHGNNNAGNGPAGNPRSPGGRSGGGFPPNGPMRPRSPNGPGPANGRSAPNHPPSSPSQQGWRGPGQGQGYGPGHGGDGSYENGDVSPVPGQAY
ncbi:hypothetical protein VTI28DRAFT_2416 [Corynascus sepedonium]